MAKVVVVDDDDDMRELMAMLLRDAHAVTTAVDGADGLAKVKELKPDLVVLDLLMPKMHGFEVCQRIREDAELKGVKVLIASSKSYQHDIKTAVEETGANGYIVKPFQIADFKKRVADALAGTK